HGCGSAHVTEMMQRPIHTLRRRAMYRPIRAGVLARLLRGLPWVVLLVGFVCNSAAQSIEVTDDRGHTLVFQQTPERIVSLLPSLTETVCALGRCSSLVGVDRYSTWPESVRHVVQLGSGLEPNVEAIVALRPDVVLLSNASRVTHRLEGLGLKVLALEPRT